MVKALKRERTSQASLSLTKSIQPPWGTYNNTSILYDRYSNVKTPPFPPVRSYIRKVVDNASKPQSPSPKEKSFDVSFEQAIPLP